jgi:hypothetical protein
MYKRLTQLSFVIGLFFSMVSIILFGNMLFNKEITGLNLYTAIVFLVFGIYMILIERKDKDSKEG